MRCFTRFATVSMILAPLFSAACEREQREAPGSRDLTGDTAQQQPLVGGPCSYQPLTFRATVDSIYGDGALLVRPDSAPANPGACGHLIRDAGMGRWRVPAPGGGSSANVGDTVEVAGEVIVMGTCAPCYVNTTVSR